jgi:predicted PurR-regulated permease PerM
MATETTPPLRSDPATPAAGEKPLVVPLVTNPETAEEVEVLQSSIKAGSVAQIVVAAVAVIGLIYLLKLVLITIFASMLLAFTCEPLVSRLQRIRIPRWVGSLVAVMILIAASLAVSYFFYNRALEFALQLPKLSSKLGSTVGKLRRQTHRIEETTRSVMGPDDGKKPVPVEVQQAPGLSSLFSEGSGAVGEVVLAIGFVPFLVYFMLTWKDHAHAATVQLFPREHRMKAHRTVGRISKMIRSFIVGNVVVGVVISIISLAVFWYLGIQYFYFLAVISGFVSLIPYLGVFLALLPPLAGGVGTLDKTGIAIIFVTVVGLHILTMNVLYPKIVGKRLRLNPLAVTLALLFWAWIWGAMGLILAVPIVGATKIVCDYIDKLQGFGAWLGE